MDHAEDLEAIAAVLAGDRDAYAVLVTRYQKPIFHLMFRMTGSYEDALDLAQETFIKAFENLHRFKKGKRFFPWLYTIGLNHSKNFLRTKKGDPIPLEEWDPGSDLDRSYSPQQEEVLCAQIDMRRLRSALDQLPFDYREAIVLRYHEELPMEEVAEALGITAGNARIRVFRGLRKLREILERGDHGRIEEKPSAAGLRLRFGAQP